MSYVRHVVVLGDHQSGKTTLIAALTGCRKYVGLTEMHEASCVGEAWGGSLSTVCCDRLLGSTLDCRFEKLHNPCYVNDAEGDRKIEVVLIDTPGHPRYATNTISGIGIADAALIVVSAVPEELEQSLGLDSQLVNQVLYAVGFGITRFVVAVTKIDHPSVECNSDRFVEVRDTVLHYLGDAPAAALISAEQFFPVASLSGDSRVDRLSAQLLQMMSYSNATDHERNQIDDSFIAIGCRTSTIAGERVCVLKPVFGKLQVPFGATGLRVHLHGCGWTTLFRSGKMQKVFRTYTSMIRSYPRNVKLCCDSTGDSIECYGDLDFGGPPRGIIVASPSVDIGQTQRFRAKMRVLHLPCRALHVGFEAVIHAHTGHWPCRVTALTRLVDGGQGATGADRTSTSPTSAVKCVYENDLVVMDFESISNTSKFFLLYPFADLPALGRVLFRAGSCLIGFGTVLSVETVH